MATAVQTRLSVSVESARQFLRVDHTDEDDLIEVLVSAAKATADAFLNNAFEDDDGVELPIPAPVRLWVLRRVATTFENRLEGVRLDNLDGLGTVDYGSRVGDAGGNDYALLRPYRLNPGL